MPTLLRRARFEVHSRLSEYQRVVLHFWQMRNTITVRITEEIAVWLEEVSRKTGLPRGRIIRDQLEKAKDAAEPPFMSLAGAILGPKDLSRRKGFSR
jgi:hypothetical protein